VDNLTSETAPQVGRVLRLEVLRHVPRTVVLSSPWVLGKIRNVIDSTPPSEALSESEFFNRVAEGSIGVYLIAKDRGIFCVERLYDINNHPYLHVLALAGTNVTRLLPAITRDVLALCTAFGCGYLTAQTSDPRFGRALARYAGARRIAEVWRLNNEVQIENKISPNSDSAILGGA
jgi:hypothetical protein